MSDISKLILSRNSTNSHYKSLSFLPSSLEHQATKTRLVLSTAMGSLYKFSYETAKKEKKVKMQPSLQCSEKRNSDAQHAEEKNGITPSTLGKWWPAGDKVLQCVLNMSSNAIWDLVPESRGTGTKQTQGPNHPRGCFQARTFANRKVYSNCITFAQQML